ncbi:MAG TPA: sigma-70 family RNA polymerase sigma factor [Thermoanaerobaculia bacterium]|nr:sigma-70 family RNA polymerase sigma factor [Thermoanaerobaculia bacterium]
MRPVRRLEDGKGAASHRVGKERLSGKRVDVRDAGSGLLAVAEESRPALPKLFSKNRVALADAEDIMQEAMVVMVRRWEEIKQPERYLFGTVWRLMQVLIRRRLREKWVELDEELLGEAALVSSAARSVEAREDARRLLALLPERAGLIVEMRYGQELSEREIAAVLKLAVSGVRKIAGRQLVRLRRAAKISESSARVGRCQRK